MDATDARSLVLAIGSVAFSCIAIAYALVGSKDSSRVMTLLAALAMVIAAFGVG